jgi:lysophospholipase L1-like esterase
MHYASRLAGPDHVTLPHDLRRRLPRRGLLHALVIAAPLLAGVPAAAQTADQQASSERWIATWTAPQAARLDQPPQSLPALAQAYPWVRDVPQAVKDVTPDQELPVGGASPLQIKGQTLRQIAHVSLGGPRVRVVLSNSLGTLPLRVGAAHVALRATGASIVAASDHVLTFGGLPHSTIPPGALLISDPVDLAVPDYGDLAVDLYLPDDTSAWKSPVSLHPASWQVNYVSEPGDHAGAPAFPVAGTTAYRRSDGLPSASSFFLGRVEVVRTDAAGVLVAFGDSITDGTQSGIDQNKRWPDLLGARLAAAGTHMAVVNGGIGGGRVLEDGVGPNALARFDRDVLAQPGVRYVTILEGINDIGVGGANASPSVAELIAGHRQMIDRAHARGLRIFGATLTPFEGAAYWTKEGEAKRQALNDWIRTSGAYDGVLDFAAVVQDPEKPTRSRPEYDSGDHLHPSPAGYAAMANSIDLKLFQAGGR